MLCSVMFTYTLHTYVVRASYFLVDFNVINMLYAMYAISLPLCDYSLLNHNYNYNYVYNVYNVQLMTCSYVNVHIH